MDAVLDLPLVLTLDHVGRLERAKGTRPGPVGEGVAFSVADEIAAMRWLPLLCGQPDASDEDALRAAMAGYWRLRAELLEAIAAPVRLCDVTALRESSAQLAQARVSTILRGPQVLRMGDPRGEARGDPLVYAVQRYGELVAHASALPLERGDAWCELRRASARIDFCLGAVLQFRGLRGDPAQRRSRFLSETARRALRDARRLLEASGLVGRAPHQQADGEADDGRDDRADREEQDLVHDPLLGPASTSVPSARIEGTQIPTNNPCSLSTRNHR